MNKIIVTGYMASGSSAVTDLLSEYENVSCPNGSFEYVFLHCPNGVFDLEDKLLVGNNVIRSDEALAGFEQAMRDLYENGRWWFAGYRDHVSPRFMDYTAELISSICTASYEGVWYEHEKLSKADWVKNRVKGKLGTPQYSLLATDLRMAFPTPEEFYLNARSFINKTLEDIAGSESGTQLFDQLLLPHNLWRFNNYFDAEDTRVIVVSRDPRDVFILNKYVWSVRGVDFVPLPHDAETFCTYYRRMKEAEKPSSSQAILRVNFEDLVLDYDKTVHSIENLVGSNMLGAHVRKFEQLDPRKSCKNAGAFASMGEHEDEIRIIEQNLAEFLYPFDRASLDSRAIDEVF